MFDIQLENIKTLLPNGKKLFSISKFEVPYGDHILISGASGTGKTTFLHLLAGLHISNEGSVKIGSHDLNQLSEDQLCDLRLQNIGVIFQKLNLLDHLTVEENIGLVNSRGDVSNVLKKVNLAGREKDLCSTLSLGEQQRVAIARVLLQNPKIILADEPTSSLDKVNTDFILKALIEASRGKTLIVVSHDPRVSDYFANHIQFEELTK